jgi:septum formation protein
MKLVLCSASPRRREFLEKLGIGFEQRPAQVDEAQRPGEAPLAYALRLAMEKAAAAIQPGAVALAADTIVVVRDELLGKPRDRSDAARMLGRLSGIEHRVITAVCVGKRAVAVETRVTFAHLSPAQVRWLAESGDGDDKAGAYALQGLAGAFVERIDGSFSNVVGLPLAETLELLADAGVELPWAR